MDEVTLIVRLRSGDQNAFDELIRIYGPRLLRVARLMTGNARAAEELASDAFAEAFLALKRFRAESSLFSWLYAIMLNQCRWRRRREKRLVSLDQTPEYAAPQNTPDDSAELLKHIPQCLSRLSDDQCIIITMKYLDQKTTEEIAQILRIPTGTVKSRVHNSLESLRKILKELNLFPDGATDY